MQREELNRHIFPTILMFYFILLIRIVVIVLPKEKVKNNLDTLLITYIH